MVRRFKPIVAQLPDPELIDVSALSDAYMHGEIELFCVLGPTASGKTRYAVGLARSLRSITGCPVEILSADSRQIYRGMDIGTGKDLSEYGDIPYHLIDIMPAGAKYNVYQFQQDFRAAFADIRSRGSIPILCGGTGLYINAVTLPNYTFPSDGAAASAVAAAAAAATQDFSTPGLTADPCRGMRLRSASPAPLSVASLPSDGAAASAALVGSTEMTIPAGAGDGQLRSGRLAALGSRGRGPAPLGGPGLEERTTREGQAEFPKTYYIGTLVSREERNVRIDARLDTRLQNGLVEEIRGLLEGGIPASTLISYGLEYKFVTQYVTGELEYDQMRTLLATAIHQFAKRQMTWFRGMERAGVDIHWVQV